MENLDLGINLGFGSASGVDDLIEKIEVLQKNISNINEVSNIGMFTSALKDFQNLKKEIKEIKELVNATQDVKSNNGDTKNPYKSETFSVSQTLKNIEKSLNEITNINKNKEHKNEVENRKNKNIQRGPEEKVNKINNELKNYYNSKGKNYKINNKINTENISPMTEKQFNEGFSKFVNNISKEIADTLDKSIREKMVKQGSVDMLKRKDYNTEKELVDEYKKISNFVKNAGFNENLLKNNSQFKREYNELSNILKNNIDRFINTENRLRKFGVDVKSYNTDNMSTRQIQNVLQENRNILRLITSDRFKNFNKNVEYKSTQDKLNDYRRMNIENNFRVQDIKNKGLSFPNTIQQNAGLVFAGIEAFRYLGTITNFITSKDFERNMGALGIVGGLGNQASQNYSKNRIIRESNIIGADINDFAEGVREVIKTGKTYEQSMNLVSVAGKIAIASFEDLSTATDILNARFTALNLNANDKNLNEFANRLQSALDNTALDLQDVRNAGKQTNTAMNAIINSAEERGLQNKSVEQYTMDVSNLELALLSTLKQQGKSGEQSGVVLRTLFTKLMSVDGVGKKMLNNDFKNMSKEKREKVGFGSVEEMTSLVLGGEIEKVIQGLSIMQKQGNLAYSTIKKIFTERHSSAISTLFSEINGDVKKFVDNVTIGVNVFSNFSKAMENWSVKVDRIFKNIKLISTNTFTKGLHGGILGSSVGILNNITDTLVKGQSSDNILLSSGSQAITQSMIQGFAFKNINDFTKGKAIQNIKEAYELAKNRINADTVINDNVKSFRLSKLNEMKNNDLEKVIDDKGVKSFAGQVKNATTNVYELSSSIKNAVETGNKGFSSMSLSIGSIFKSLAGLVKPALILLLINSTINTIIGMYEKAQKLKNDADNLDKEIVNISKLGKDIEMLEENIKTIFNLKDVKEPNIYISNINKMIQANENLKASIDNINSIKNNLFKNLDTIREEIWKEKTKNVLNEKYSPDVALKGRGNFDFKGDIRTIEYGNKARFSIGEWGDEYSRNVLVKYRGNQFKDLNIYDEKDDLEYLNKLNSNEYKSSAEKMSSLNLERSEKIKQSSKNIKNYNKELKIVDKKINSIYDNAYNEFKGALSMRGMKEKDISKEEKDKFIVSRMKISKDIISDVFGEEIVKQFGENGIQSTSDFYKLLKQLDGDTLEEKTQTFYKLIASGKIEPETIDFLGKYGNYQLETIKESNDIFYKQLERNKESFEQSKAMVENYKNQLFSMYENTNLPTVAYGKLLEEEKDDEGKLKTLSQSELDKYNVAYNNEINSISKEMFTNNIQGVKDYQASMSVYFQKKASLDKQMSDTIEEIEKMKKEGNQQEVDNLNKKLEYIKKDTEMLDKSKELAKKVLHFSNFSAKTYQELLTMGTELAKNYAQYEGLVGSSFGNKGSQLETQLSVFTASRGLYNKIGKMNFNNQVSSAYIQDVDGAKLKTITGKSDYSKVNLNDYNKVQSEIDSYRKENITTRNGISIEDLQEQATMISSLVAEQYNMKQQELGFMQQEKQLQIDITKYYLERNKLIANFTESAETKQSDIDIKSANINYTMRYGNGKYGSIEELQRVTNLKLENSNLKMKDQLDYAKRQIMVAKENSTRQINAIRRLENKNTSNSQKSDTQAKQNSNETNRTIVESANTISNNLNNALNQIMTTIQTMQTVFSPVDNTGNLGMGDSVNISVGTGGNYTQLPNMTGKGYKNAIPLLQAVSKMTGADYDLLAIVGNQESSFNPNLVSNTSSAKGLYQWLEKYNSDYVKQYGAKYGINGKANLFDPRISAIMAGEMFVKNYNELKNSGINPTKADLYMAHFYPKYKNYLKSGKINQKANTMFSSEAIRANAKHLFYNNDGSMKTIAQVRDSLWETAIKNAKGNGLTGVNLSTSVNQNVQGIQSSGLKFDKNPIGVDPNLVRLLQDTNSMAKKQGIDFKVPSSGVWRDSAEQNTYFKQGGSKADGYKKLSRHQRGQALDIHILKGGEKAYGEVNKIVQQLANQRGMKIEWGGSWKGFYDPYHFQVNNSQWDSHKNPNLRTQGGLSGGTLQVQNITLPKAYIPKLDKVTQEDIEKITNYELYKDQIKTEKDEQMLNELANLLKSLEGETYNVSIAKLTEKKNAIKSIQTPDETYDVSLNVIEQAISNFENKLETGLENISKLQHNFIETLTELQFSFRELKNIVNSTNIEYTNAFNFLEQVSFTERFNEFMFKIEETQVKLEQYNKKLALETNYNNSVRQNLFGLLDKHNINIENNPLETGEDMKKFLSNREQMLDVMSIVEDMIGESISKNFDTLEFDKSSLKNVSNEEIDKMKYEMATKLSEKESDGQKLIFGSSAELTNLFETLKLLKSQIEKTNEVRKTEIDLIKQNTKYLSEYSKNISNMLKEVNLTDNSKARNIRTLLAENSLVNKGISLESNYAKNYIGNVNARNKYEEYQEEMYNFNRSLKYDSSLRSILKSNGYSDDYLNNYNLNNMNYNDISNMANVILDYQDRARYTVQQELNNLIDKFSLTDKFKDVDLTDMEIIRNLNAETLANETGNSVENMKEFLNGVNIVKNSVHNTDNILETLTKVLNANKMAHEESTRMYQELYKQGLNLLSDMLFGEGDFKGLSSEQYTQALDSLLQYSISNFGSISKSFKGLFNKDKNILSDINTKVDTESNKQENVLDTDNLLETLNKNNVKLMDTIKHQDLIVSADKGLLILPDELKRNINKNLEEKPLLNFETLDNINFGKKVEDISIKEPQLFSAVPYSLLNTYIKDYKKFKYVTNYTISDTSDTLPLEIFNNKELRNKILNNGSDVNSQLALENDKQKKKATYNDIANLTLNGIVVLDGFMRKQMQYKKQELELQGKILEMNLQMAETSEERRRIEEQILQNKLAQVDNEYNTNSLFMGGAISGSTGFGIQGALSGAMTGMSLGGGVGAIVGAGLGLVGGLFGGSKAKIQAEQQKAQLIAQQKLTWLAEDRNKYLKNMASAMSEQAKWTTKIGVNDAISRSVKAVISSVDTIGGTASDTRTVQNKKKKGGGLFGSKKYDTVQSFTASYNTNDPMFGGRIFDDRTDLEYGYGVLAKRILGNQSLYLDKKIASSSIELNADQFIKAFNGQATLGSMGMLIDTSRDEEIRALISSMKDQYSKMEASQSKVDMLALINFYENIQALLDKEGKTTKRLFGNYYSIETEEVKDEKGNITEYRRINESMWSDYYNQIYQNVMNGTNVFDTGSKFIQGTLNAFIQNVGSGRNTVKALTDEFNRLADEIYDVVTRTGEFSNVSGSIKGLIDNTALLKEQQRETENFTIDLAKRWVSLGGNITDVVKDMNNGLSLTIDNIKSNMLGDSLENTINNFGNNLFQKLGESMTTNLVNQKYANSIFKMNGLLTNATDTNSISDIVALANGYKGMSVQIESDRERLSAIQRLFTANRDIDYVDESIQYETGTSQSVTNNYTFTTDINAGTIVADELSKEILAQNLFGYMVQMFKDSGLIK